MPVTQYCNQRFQNQRDLYQFLSQCQRDFDHLNSPQIISISFSIQPVDPLVVFNQLAQPKQLNFYFEKQEPAKHYSQAPQQIAIAGIDSVLQVHTHDHQRFAQSKHFIQQTLAHALVAGDSPDASTGPTFFCSFTFQDHSEQTEETGFPSGTIFLPKWQITRQNQTSTVVHNLILDSTTAIAQTVESIWQTLESIQSLTSIKFLANSAQTLAVESPPFKTQDITPTRHFKQAVEAALTAIQTQQFNKIVLAHAIDITAPLPFQPAACLYRLRQIYPDCYRFAVSNQAGQTFLGASPERLACIQNRQLTTDALAGSAPRGQTPREDTHLAHALLSSSKDNYEHQLVVDFIMGKLTALGLTPERSPLRLLQLSNIQHLHTPIHSRIPSSVHLLDILAALHPTPAVAGLPRDIACAEITRREPFARSLYAAPIGWVNHRGDGEFIVGIRSALIQGCQARLVAGAGIVAGSEPDRELAEVQLKLQALLANLT